MTTMKDEIKNSTILLILAIGAMLGMASTRLSSLQPQSMPISIVEKPIPIPGPAIGGTEIELQIPDVTFAFPVATDDWYVTSEFGKRMSPKYKVYRHHEATDISVENARAGMPQIVAIADGTIRDHWLGHPTKGKWIIIDHDNGMVSSYAHLSISYIHERRPDGTPWRVKAGEVIGRMGATGEAFGAHLHFELEIDGVLVNPMLYLDQVLPEWESLTVDGDSSTL